MATLQERILALVEVRPGLTDREITDELVGRDAPQQSTNQACRSLESRRRLYRRQRPDGKLGNYPSGVPSALPTEVSDPACEDPLGEDGVKRFLKAWLESKSWQVEVVWGKGRGIDLEARSDGKRWIIEAKGRGSLDPMRVNYFLAVLGETLQRMSDPEAQYSIALPDLPQFRNLWARLPALAKHRTGISALFVAETGEVSEVP